MLRIDITGLADGLHTQTLAVDADDLGVDSAVFDDVRLDVRLDMAEHRILAAFDVRAVATLECDRTLVPYAQPVGGRHAVLFIAAEQLAPEAEGDDVQPLADGATSLDLTAAVRDTLLLALPLRRIAPEAEDAPLPTAFGAPTDEEGRPIDDRWEALRHLAEREGSGDDAGAPPPANPS